MTTKAEKEEALAHLRQFVTRNGTVYAIVRHVSRSNMSRNIDFAVICGDGIVIITPMVARALGYTHNRDSNGIRIAGCGFDAAQHVTDALAKELFGSSNELRREWL